MTPIQTIGILYPGEMGSSLGRLLLDNGLSVVTTVQGRSARTQRLCREAALPLLASLREVIEVSAFIVSLVPPASALPLAEEFCALADCAPAHQIYVDANSISPASSQHIATLLEKREIPFVDAGIHGLASQLAQHGTLYLSGQMAAEVATVFSPCLRVEVLGDAPGQASAFKMLMGGLSKGLAALFIELSLAAREAGLLDELLRAYRAHYPDVMTVIERILPTYPLHARRRAEEMQELEAMLLGWGQCPHLAGATQRTIEAVGTLDLAKNAQREKDKWSLEEVIEAIYERNPLCRKAS